MGLEPVHKSFSSVLRGIARFGNWETALSVVTKMSHSKGSGTTLRLVVLEALLLHQPHAVPPFLRGYAMMHGHLSLQEVQLAVTNLGLRKGLGATALSLLPLLVTSTSGAAGVRVKTTEVDDALLTACAEVGRWELGLSIASSGEATARGLTPLVMCCDRTFGSNWAAAVLAAQTRMNSQPTTNGCSELWSAVAALLARRGGQWETALDILKQAAALHDKPESFATQAEPAVEAVLAATPLSAIPALVGGPLRSIVDPLRTVNTLLKQHPQVLADYSGRTAVQLARQFASTNLVTNVAIMTQDTPLWDEALRMVNHNMKYFLVKENEAEFGNGPVADADTMSSGWTVLTECVAAAVSLVGTRKALLQQLVGIPIVRRGSHWSLGLQQCLVPPMVSLGMVDEAAAVAGYDAVALHLVATDVTACRRALAMTTSRTAAASVLLLSRGHMWQEGLRYCCDDMEALRRVGLPGCVAGSAWVPACRILERLGDQRSAAEDKLLKGLEHRIACDEACRLAASGKWSDAICVISSLRCQHRLGGDDDDERARVMRAAAMVCQATLNGGAWLEAIRLLPSITEISGSKLFRATFFTRPETSLLSSPVPVVFQATSALEQIMEDGGSNDEGRSAWAACLAESTSCFGGSSETTLQIGNVIAFGLHLRSKSGGVSSDAVAAFSLLSRLLEQSAVKFPPLVSAVGDVILKFLPHLRANDDPSGVRKVAVRWIEELCLNEAEAADVTKTLVECGMDEAVDHCKLASLARWPTSSVNMSQELSWEAALRHVAILQIGEVMSSLANAGRLTDTVDVLAWAARHRRIRSSDYHVFAAVLRAISHPDVTPMDCREAGRRLLVHAGQEATNHVVQSIKNLLDGPTVAHQDTPDEQARPAEGSTLSAESFVWTRPRIAALAMYYPQLAEHFVGNGKTPLAQRDEMCREVALKAFGTASVAPVVASVMTDPHGREMLRDATVKQQQRQALSVASRDNSRAAFGRLTDDELLWFASHGLEVAYAVTDHVQTILATYPPNGSASLNVREGSGSCRALRRIFFRNRTLIRRRLMEGGGPVVMLAGEIPDAVATRSLLAELSRYVPTAVSSSPLTSQRGVEPQDIEWMNITQDLFFSIVTVRQVVLFWRKHEKEIEALARKRWGRALEEELSRRFGGEGSVPATLNGDPSKSTADIVEYWQTFGMHLAVGGAGSYRGRLPAAAHRELATAALVAWSHNPEATEEEIARSVLAESSVSEAAENDLNDTANTIRQLGMGKLRDSAHFEALLPLASVNNSSLLDSESSFDGELSADNHDAEIELRFALNSRGPASTFTTDCQVVDDQGQLRWKLGLRVVMYARRIIDSAAAEELVAPFATCMESGDGKADAMKTLRAAGLRIKRGE